MNMCFEYHRWAGKENQSSVISCEKSLKLYFRTGELHSRGTPEGIMKLFSVCPSNHKKLYSYHPPAQELLSLPVTGAVKWKSDIQTTNAVGFFLLWVQNEEEQQEEPSCKMDAGGSEDVGFSEVILVTCETTIWEVACLFWDVIWYTSAILCR